MGRGSRGYAAGFVLAVGLLLAACASGGSTNTTLGSAEVVTGDAQPSTTSHMMGMSAGLDPEPAAVDASPYVFGILPHAVLSLDPGITREVAVIAQGEPAPGTNAVPVVVRNMTRDTVYGIRGHVDLLDADGLVVDSGDFSFLAPLVVAPGEIAFGAMPANPDWDPTSGTLRAKVDSFNVMAPDPESQSMAVVTTAVVDASSIVGTVVNDTDSTFVNGVTVTALCFDRIRRPSHVASVDLSGSLSGGGSADFSIPLAGNATRCTQVLLAALEIE